MQIIRIWPYFQPSFCSLVWWDSIGALYFVYCLKASILEASPRLRFVVISDFRGNRFANKPQPSDLDTTYVIRRGKTVDELTQLAFEKLKYYPPTQHFSFKFCAGINNFLSKDYFSDFSVWARTSGLSPGGFIENLTEIKSSVKWRFPNASVAFATIPSVSFDHIQNLCVHSRLQRNKKIFIKELVEFLTAITQALDQVNLKIKEINKLERRWAIELAEVIKKHHKKSCGRNKENWEAEPFYFICRCTGQCQC